MSKNEFKRAVGNLLKNGRIRDHRKSDPQDIRRRVRSVGAESDEADTTGMRFKGVSL